METYLTIAAYLPVIMVVIGGALLFIFARQNDITRVVLSLAVEVFFYYLLDAQLVNPYADPHWTTLSMALIPALSPFAIAFLICWIWKIYFEKNLPWHQFLWFAPPIAIFSACITLYFVIGSEEVTDFQMLFDKLRHFPEQYMYRRDMRLLYLIEYNTFTIAFSVYSAWAIGFAIYTMKRTGFTFKAFYAFWFKKASLPPSHLLMWSITILLVSIGLRIIAGRFFLFDHPHLIVICSTLQAICVALIALAGYCSDYIECTLRQFFFLDPKEDLDMGLFNDEEEECAGTSHKGKEEDEEESLDPDAFQLVQERIESGLHIMMEQDKAFLDSDLRLSEVARKLGTNRNYLSRHINEKYHINFNEYLNRMRIEYSKDFMLRNPNMLLDTIALECGFSTAQSFGRKFKSIEGVTPRSWLVSLLKTQKKL